jgi:hypothetical protein
MAYILRQLFEMLPKSLPLTSVLEVALVEGVIAVSTLEVKLTVSVVASPKITLPLKVDIPDTITLVKDNKSVAGL